MARLTGTIVVDLSRCAGLIADLRREMADVLRAEAEAEASGYVAARLREVAAAFEAGQRPGRDS